MPSATVANLFADLPAPPREELFTILAQSADTRVERIVSPPGSQTAPGEWYDQEWDEWVMVLRGAAALEIEGQPVPIALAAGDHLLLPARLRHRVASTAAGEVTIWLAVHYR